MFDLALIALGAFLAVHPPHEGALVIEDHRGFRHHDGRFPAADFEVELGDIELTECQMINQFRGEEGAPPRFTKGYGLSFGHGERKAMAMALVDRALRVDEVVMINLLERA